MQWPGPAHSFLDGFCLLSDAKIVRYLDHYLDERGLEMWRRVMRLLETLKLQHHPGNLLSTVNDGSCILVIVHSVSSDHLIARHNQLLAFRIEWTTC